MSNPSTLLKLGGGEFGTVDWSNCAVVFIDFQNEYVDGEMPLGQAGAKATANARLILDKARNDNIPVFHIAHHGEDNGNVFDPLSSKVNIVDSMQPVDSEKTIVKMHPNAFYDTPLQELIESTGKEQIIFTGFMSHMCVSSSVRAAFDLGFENFVCHDACATRDLPDVKGNAISADVVHETAMAALQDRFATLVATNDLVNG
ncbi:MULTISPECIES: cysteine hydrolase family protein [Psychrobacter]|uniref:cysteine hydrolase family protein n=1 Tax=Psychrobacter TaxID=497 RepID=UPI00191B413C|nr:MULTISPECIES: cysteine hydrolase family protein [Psychrobacter]